MADEYKGLTIEFRGDTSSLSAALRKIRSESSGVAKELKTIERAMKFNPSSAALATRQIELMKRQIEGTAKQLAAYKAAEDQIGKSNMSSEAWTKLQADIAIAENKLKNFNRELSQMYIKQDAANSILGRMGTSLTNFGTKYKDLGLAMSSVGRTLTHTVTPAIIATGVASVAAAVDIDTSLTNVKKTVDGTEARYQALKQAAIDFSKTNAVSASEMLDIQALGAQLGFAIDELQEFGEVVSGLDIATNMDAEQAATELAHFANVTGMAHDKISNYGSSIVELGNNFATTESDISAMAMRIAGAGTQIGMSQADILGLAAALSSLGLEAEAGGSAISAIMTRIDSAVAHNDETLSTWADTAKMSAEEFAAAWNSDPVEALASVLSGMEQAVNEGGNMNLILEELGITSLRQTDTLKRMAGAYDLVTDATETANRAWDENTALSKEVENRNNSLAAKFEMIKNRLVAIGDAIGGPVADAFLDVLDAAEPLIQAIEDGAKAFSEMSKEEQQTALAGVALVAALGPMLSLIGGGITKASAFGSALTKLAEMLAKIGGAGSGALSGVEGIAGAMAKAEKATGLSATALGVWRVALAGLGIAGAIAVIAAFASTIQDCIKHQEALDKATNGLRDSLANVPMAVEDAASALSAQGDAVRDAALSYDELIEKQGILADAINERNSAAGNDIAQLESYAKTIEELSGKSLTSQEDIGRLKAAVDGLNEALGTDYQIQISDDGTFRIMAEDAEIATEKIRELIDAKKLAIETDVISQDATDAYQAEADAAASLAQKEKELADARQKLADIKNDPWADPTNITQAQEEVDKYEGEVRDLTKCYDEAAKGAKYFEDTLYLLEAAQTEAATAGTKFVAGSGALRQALSLNQQSALEFAKQIDELGIDTERLSSLTPAQLAQVGMAYDGTVQSIIRGLSDVGIEIDATSSKLYQAFNSLGEGASFDAFASSFGMTVDQMLTKMSELGIGAEEMANMTPEVFRSMAEGLGVSIGDMARILQESGVAIPEAVQSIVDQAAQQLQGFQDAFNSAFGEGSLQAFADNLGMSMDEVVAMLSEKGVQVGEVTQQMVTDMANALNQSPKQIMAALSALGAQIPEAVSEAFAGAAPAAQEAGAEATAAGGQGMQEGLAETDLSSAVGEVVNQALESARGHEGEFTSIGTSLGNSVSTGFAQADMASMSGAVQNAVSLVQGHEGDFLAAGTASGDAYTSGFASSDSGVAAELATQVVSAIQGMDGEFSNAGTNQGNQYAQGVQSADGYGAGAALANAANSGASSVDGYSSGANFGAGFVNGIRDYIGEAIAAAQDMVNAAKEAADAAANSHSPSREMMKRGKWFDQGFAAGITDNANIVREASAQAVNEAMAMLRENDAWVYGVHTATNYADGLYSGISEIKDSAGKLAEDTDAELNAYIDDMIAGYRSRADDFKEVSTLISDYIWGSFAPEVYKQQYTLPNTGKIYKAMKKIQEAGYEDLQDFMDAKEQFEKDRGSDKSKDAEWNIEYKKFQSLLNGLGASLDDLKVWEPLYNVKDELISEITTAEDWSDTLVNLSKRNGIVFSKNFVDRIVDGGEEAQQALKLLATGSDAEIQRMVDSYDDLNRAEREAEINQRSLWVNSLDVINSKGEDARDWLLDYRETCLDVKEALYSDAGLSGAFDKSGVSVEEFSYYLKSAGMTMDDYLSKVEAYTAKVTNGFDQMTSYGQTSFADWQRNLKLNMAESQAYAENLAAVMEKIPESIDSEAFRKAVAEGGFDQWGKVMADMAKMNEADIQAAVELYNEAIVEAQQSAIEQMRALSPGEELMMTTLEGMTAKQQEINEQMAKAAAEAAAAADETYPEWEQTGSHLASGIAFGIQGQIGAIAAMAANTVRAALAAAKAEAAIGSPSKKMRDEVGAMLGKGLGLGLKDEQSYIAEQARKLVNIPLAELKRSQSVSNKYFNDQSRMTNVWNVTVRNDQDMRQLIKKQNKVLKRASRAEAWA